jgi:hypothetical protein
MHPNSRFRPAPLRRGPVLGPLLGSVPFVAIFLAACSGGDRDAANARIAARAGAGCGSLDTSAVVAKAVTQFITTTDPKPLRFLYMAGTDSTLPDAGQRAVQDKGPTYLWPANPAQQPVVRKKLEDAGPWNALLITYKGIDQPTPETARVRIGGTWIGPVDDGKQLGVKAATFECSTVGDSAHSWQFKSIASEQGA